MLRSAAVFTLLFCALASSSRAAAVDQPAAASAAPPAAASTAVAASADPRVALLKLLPAGSKLDDLRPSPIPGIYEFMQGAEISYLTADGKYFIDGNLYDMKSRDNLTEALRTHARIALINSVPETEMLIFSPPNPKYTITVFTDVDCAYCRKLHSQIAEINRLGIRVRYMFFPRTGPGTESWKKAEVVWCSTNRNEALTRAKAGATLDMNKVCAPTPVKREYELGENIGVRGTPAIITESGDYISGYMEPRELLDQLKEFQVAKR
ncbi:MAG TPA: DsbC family protein [Steroidobacteraceae bacterium]|nr:DsbC family protein [Steroidobacteraceae bacterium]